MADSSQLPNSRPTWKSWEERVNDVCIKHLMYVVALSPPTVLQTPGDCDWGTIHGARGLHLPLVRMLVIALAISLSDGAR